MLLRDGDNGREMGDQSDDRMVTDCGGTIRW